MHATLASRAIVAAATLLLLGACNEPFASPPNDPSISRGEQVVKKPQPHIEKGLLAAVDQHAAGVRDILLLGVEGSAAVAGAVLLAGYAKGLLDEAGTDGGRLRVAVGECWHRADWLTVRVLAICALSRDDDWRRPLHTAP
jgi:hypothetical protein